MTSPSPTDNTVRLRIRASLRKQRDRTEVNWHPAKLTCFAVDMLHTDGSSKHFKPTAQDPQQRKRTIDRSLCIGSAVASKSAWLYYFDNVYIFHRICGIFLLQYWTIGRTCYKANPTKWCYKMSVKLTQVRKNAIQNCYKRFAVQCTIGQSLAVDRWPLKKCIFTRFWNDTVCILSNFTGTYLTAFWSRLRIRPICTCYVDTKDTLHLTPGCPRIYI